MLKIGRDGDNDQKNNHQTENSVWLVFNKGPGRTMSWQDIVEEALCFGWIDSRPSKVSDTRSKIYISKRRPKSVWSIDVIKRVEQTKFCYNN